MYSFGDKSFSKASHLAGRPAAHTQICPLYKKELRSALCSPLVITYLKFCVNLDHVIYSFHIPCDNIFEIREKI